MNELRLTVHHDPKADSIHPAAWDIFRLLNIDGSALKGLWIKSVKLEIEAGDVAILFVEFYNDPGGDRWVERHGEIDIYAKRYIITSGDMNLVCKELMISSLILGPSTDNPKIKILRENDPIRTMKE